jgi:endonuclease YncB( thermonuclease family)
MADTAAPLRAACHAVRAVTNWDETPRPAWSAPPWQAAPGPPPGRRRNGRRAGAVGLAAALALAAAVALARAAPEGPAGSALATGSTGTPSASPSAPGEPEQPLAEQPVVEPAPDVAVADPAGPLLRAAPGGDGDSWRDTEGREYRLGLVNAPETDECFGAEATRERQAMVADGFRADVYETDRYGRSVAVVTTASGVRLNTHLARRGFADDRYLSRFRHENPALAAELDAAFAAAKAERAGLWGACGRSSAPQAAAPPPAAPPPPVAPAVGGGCHPDYVTCVPVKGNGSGHGGANDLDCGAIGQRVQVRQRGVDPYRLDANADGWGCESYG